MADKDHPKTHVEDQDLKTPRKQPLSPQHEGIDPLTESDTMLPRTDTKADSEQLGKKTDKAAAKQAEDGTSTPENKAAEKTVSDQEERNAEASTPDTSEETPEVPVKPTPASPRAVNTPEHKAPGSKTSVR